MVTFVRSTQDVESRVTMQLLRDQGFHFGELILTEHEIAPVGTIAILGRKMYPHAVPQWAAKTDQVFWIENPDATAEKLVRSFHLVLMTEHETVEPKWNRSFGKNQSLQ